ncbi:MAG: response regulator [Burkholderiaceae bacterium]
MTIRILLADHDALMREGLKYLLHGDKDISVADEASDGYETLRKVRADGIDLVVFDLSMPGPHGIDLIRQVKREVPKLPILILTMQDEKQFAVRAITAGAHGYVTKESTSAELIKAIRQIAAGRPYISLRVAELLSLSIMPPSSDIPHERLSKREFEIFSMLVNGESNAQVAERLQLSVKTISSHKQNILTKMCLGSVADMVQYAITENLIEPKNSYA